MEHRCPSRRLLATLGDEPAAWVGHSFGGRLAFELAARRPAVVQRLVLLDPAMHLPAEVALFAAERERRDRSYESFESAIEQRYEESQLHHAPRELLEAELHDHLAESDDGRWRYRYCQSAVIAAYSEMAKTPPSFTDVDLPTLVVLGARSYLPYDHLLDAHRAALGGLLHVDRVPGGHTVLWDALDETVDVIHGFLSDDALDARATPVGQRRPLEPPLPRSSSGERYPSQYSSAIASASSRIAMPSSASSRVIVSGGTTMITFQCVIR